MTNLTKFLWILVVVFWVNACGESKDSRESQTLNTNDSQSKYNESSTDSSIESSANPQDSNESNNEATHALIPNPSDLQNATYIEKKQCGFFGEIYR